MRLKRFNDEGDDEGDPPLVDRGSLMDRGCRETLFGAYIAVAARHRSRYKLGCHDAAIHPRLYGPIKSKLFDA